jgi:SH3-like domain-containing protein
MPTAAYPQSPAAPKPLRTQLQTLEQEPEMTKSTTLTWMLGASLLSAAGGASALCVTSAQANLRGGPGTAHPKTWEVYQYMPLKEIGRRGNWYHVKDVDGDRHWVHKSLVSRRVHCAVVKANRANVRTGPGTGYRASDWSPIGTYYSVKAIKHAGQWVKVEDEVGNTGWIAKSLLWYR